MLEFFLKFTWELFKKPLKVAIYSLENLYTPASVKKNFIAHII